MRADRKRRREGSFIVRVQLDQPDIDGFFRLKLLRPDQRQDTEALQVIRADDLARCVSPWRTIDFTRLFSQLVQKQPISLQ
jgi:hypothetical protein